MCIYMYARIQARVSGSQDLASKRDQHLLMQYRADCWPHGAHSATRLYMYIGNTAASLD